jgi:hypothetical protein
MGVYAGGLGQLRVRFVEASNAFGYGWNRTDRAGKEGTGDGVALSTSSECSTPERDAATDGLEEGRAKQREDSKALEKGMGEWDPKDDT